MLSFLVSYFIEKVLKESRSTRMRASLADTSLQKIVTKEILSGYFFLYLVLTGGLEEKIKPSAPVFPSFFRLTIEIFPMKCL